MTTPRSAGEADDHPDTGGDALDLALRSFAVVARFRRVADDGRAAEAEVRRELAAVQDQYAEVRVEPREPDGRWAVDVRFVVASLDAETALEGVHGTLRDGAVVPDETWVAAELA